MADVEESVEGQRHDDENLETLTASVIQLAARDRSPAARKHRRQLLYRAIFGEFMCATIFYCLLYFYLAHTATSQLPAQFKSVGAALVSGLGTIAVTYAFSEISGAQVNPAVSFALWLTGKASNRRFFAYVLVQCTASILACGLVWCTFTGSTTEMYEAIMVFPRIRGPKESANDFRHDRDILQVIATEFILTFFLTFMAFITALEGSEVEKVEHFSLDEVVATEGITVYSTRPQSSTGFAPFAIGCTVFSLSIAGGASEVAMNPARIFGPAICTGSNISVSIL